MAPVCCLLLLLTGLPAAGKSTFAAALQERLSSSLPLAPLRVVQSLRLDDYMVLTEKEQHDKEQRTAFSPAQWHAASEALLKTTETTLCLLLSHPNGDPTASSSPSTTVYPSEPVLSSLPVVVVEDNMHYRSMRERYWKLCRKLEKNCTTGDINSTRMPSGPADALPVVLLLQLCFTVPLEVCLIQNEARRSPSGQPTASYIPPHVIRSMADQFELCLAPSPSGVDSVEEHDKDADAATNWWRLTPTTQPWLMMTLRGATREHTQDAVLANELVRDFLRLLASDRCRCGLLRQHDCVVQRRQAHLLAQATAAQADEHSARCNRVVVHHVDLRLRACVRCLFASPPAELAELATPEAAVVRKRVQESKKAALEAFRTRAAALTSSTDDCNDDDDDAWEAAMESVIAQFEEDIQRLINSLRK